MSEQVNPDHYKKVIETYDAITSQLSFNEVVGYLRGQILKYTMRLGSKHGGTVAAKLMDAEKGRWYQQKLITLLENNIDG